MTKQINQSWREQRKAVIAKDVVFGRTTEYRSVWEAANQISAAIHCKHETAKKEIRKAIKTGCARYGATWKWRDDD